MLCVHTKQLTEKGDNPVAKQMRKIEDLLLALFRWLKFRSPPHKIADPQRFIRGSSTFATG